MGKRKEIEFLNRISVVDVKYGEIVYLQDNQSYLKIKSNYKDFYVPLSIHKKLLEDEVMDIGIKRVFSGKDGHTIKSLKD